MIDAKRTAAVKLLKLLVELITLRGQMPVWELQAMLGRKLSPNQVEGVIQLLVCAGQVRRRNQTLVACRPDDLAD